MRWTVKVLNATRGIVLGTKVHVARGFFDRMIGLLGKNRLEEEEGLWISPCSCIHSIGMRFVFDALFLGPDGKIVWLREGFKKNRVSGIIRSACGVLELPEGTISRTKSAVGDEIRFEP